MSPMRDKNIEAARDRRNQSPTAPAVAAMYLYGAEYASQGGGSMDFWDKLSWPKKKRCEEMVLKIIDAIPNRPDKS